MKYSEDIKPISYLKANAAQMIRKLHKSHRTIIITQNGEAKAVVQDIKAFEQDRESMALLKILAQSTKEVEKGDFKLADKAFNDIEKKIKSQESR